MTQKKHNVTEERINRFAELNEKLFEKTAYAESQAFLQFKDLTLMQIQVIRLITYHKPCAMGMLAKSMGLTMGSITQLIDRLINKKYVKRIRATDDRRVVYAELTAKGRRVIQASYKHVFTVAEDMLGKFSPVEQDGMLDFFERMASD